jgi:hypothetical protein
VSFGGGFRIKPDHSEVAVPPSQEAIKRLIADLREVINTKDPTMCTAPSPSFLFSTFSGLIRKKNKNALGWTAHWFGVGVWLAQSCASRSRGHHPHQRAHHRT